MTCGCKKVSVPADAPSATDCRFCVRTTTWWAPHKSCYVFRCSNQLMLTDPPEWAYGNTRKATVGDTPNGTIIEDADWISVRSCFCNGKRCKNFCAESN